MYESALFHANYWPLKGHARPLLRLRNSTVTRIGKGIGDESRLSSQNAKRTSYSQCKEKLDGTLVEGTAFDRIFLRCSFCFPDPTERFSGL